MRAQIKDMVESTGATYRGTSLRTEPNGGLVEITLPPEMVKDLPKLPQGPMRDKFASVTIPADELSPESIRAAMSRKVVELGGQP